MAFFSYVIRRKHEIPTSLKEKERFNIYWVISVTNTLFEFVINIIK